MRKNPTEPEKRLWRYLSNSQIDGLKFRRQEVMGPYIADFMCPARSLIVEVDGDTHDANKDRLRDNDLAAFGFLVLRITNADVMQNAEGVVAAIRAAAEGRSSRHIPHPNPSPEGEGLSRAEPIPATSRESLKSPSPSGEGLGVGDVGEGLNLTVESKP